MKILKLRFCNINSLAGEWSINFEDPAYLSNGIFAITGPTGAGKTTILDAICLALYGCTPRIGSIGKKGNEVMSRQTGECFAEAVFETQKGTYRAFWSQHRSRKKAMGALQDPLHELTDMKTGKPIETKQRAVAEQIEKLTGMTFDRFKRSMLLAQGGFAAFLQASPAERAPILEQITGTVLYTHLSKYVHNRHQDEKKRLDELQKQLDGLQCLTVEQEETFRALLAKNSSEELRLDETLKQLRQMKQWLDDLQKLESDIKGWMERKKAHAQKMEAFKAQLEKLAKAEVAQKFSPDDALLSQLRQDRQNEAHKVKKVRDELQSAEQAFLDTKQKLIDSRENHEQLHQAIEIERELAQKVQILEIQKQKIEEQRKQLHHEIAPAADHRMKLSKEIAEQKKQLTAFEAAINEIETYCLKNSADGLIGSEKSAIELLYDNHAKIREQWTKAEQALKKAAALHHENTVKHRKEEELFQQRQKQLEELEAAHRVLLEERVCLIENQAKMTLDEERKRLVDGSPCPLCGSKEHPIHLTSISKPTSTDASRFYTQFAELKLALEKKIEKSQKLIEQHKTEVDIARRSKDASSLALDRSDQEMQTLKLRCKELEQEVRTAWDSLICKISPFVPDHSNATINASTLELLSQRHLLWKEKHEKKNQLCDEKRRCEHQIASKTEIAANLEISLKDKEVQLGNVEDSLKSLRTERFSLYGNKNPETEIKRLQKQLEDCDAVLKATATSYEKNSASLIELKKALEISQSAHVEREETIRVFEAAFLDKIRAAGFSDLHEYHAACLSDQEKNHLASQAQQLQSEQAKIDNILALKTETFFQEKEKKLTSLPPLTIEEEIKKSESSLKVVREEKWRYENSLKSHLETVEKFVRVSGTVEAQKKNYAKWSSLDLLIGSADGKKFRNFAQGLTFELLIHYANLQLQKLTDRYLLVQDSSTALELSVMDNYQACEVRSVKNLSGGESFLVSLALALGLSQMSSANVRIDSLFIDEGFGSLDEEALENALDTLSRLQEEGKIVGVISHVPAMKEQISTQIRVVPQSGGRSILCGPGITSAISSPCQRP